MFAFLSLVFNDPVGRWVIYAAIFVFAVVAGIRLFTIIRDRLDSIADSVGLVKDQVKNDHKTNMREESDERHEENAGKLDLLVTLVKGQGQSIESLQKGQSSLYALIVANTTDIETLKDVSDTKTRAEINKIIGDNHDGKHAEPYPG